MWRSGTVYEAGRTSCYRTAGHEQAMEWARACVCWVSGDCAFIPYIIDTPDALYSTKAKQQRRIVDCSVYVNGPSEPVHT